MSVGKDSFALLSVIYNLQSYKIAQRQETARPDHKEVGLDLENT